MWWMVGTNNARRLARAIRLKTQGSGLRTQDSVPLRYTRTYFYPEPSHWLECRIVIVAVCHSAVFLIDRTGWRRPAANQTARKDR